MTRRMRDGRYDVQADHGFRKRFDTTLKLDNGVSYNVAEKLADRLPQSPQGRRPCRTG